jgi:YVTN family beta-propeller protein
MPNRALFWVAAATLLLLQLAPPVMATRLPPDTKKTVQEIFPAGNVRLDGSVELPDHSFLLPLIPSVNPLRRMKSDGIQKFPANAAEPDLIIYENGWAHFRTRRKGSTVTLAFPDDVPEATKKRLLTMKLPDDLIVPQGLMLPKSMKTIIGDLEIPIAEDVELMQPQFGKKADRAPTPPYQGAGTFAFVSIKDGTIILMDGKTFTKIAEFPTEGTPSSMTYVDGKLYIADQAKNRILLLDPQARKFLGQIDLPPGSAPRGIVSLPNGKSIYVAFSGSSQVGMVDVESGKLLFKIKVPIGPSRLAVTPDGTYVVALSVTAANLSVITSYNQSSTGSVRTGSVPTGLVLHPTAKTAYVSNRMANTVSIIDLSNRTVLNTIKTGASPTGLAISASGDKLYVAHGRDNTIGIFDTKTLQKLNEVKLPLDVDFPHEICLSPDGKHLLISSQQTDTVGVLDTTTLEFTKQVQVGHTTQEVIWVPAG